ncbi:ferredoxin [Streptomyces sp. NPDC088752]|uniref:4Fe-4S domain-containing protein n=1 Tax=Streptomyces sp. NPDC088752 TaxID=3154963 RepID=UPI00341F46C5
MTRLRWTVRIDARCMGAGLCLGIAGESFRPNAEEGLRPRTVVVDAGVDVVDAAETCPVQAISVFVSRAGGLSED